MSRSRYTLLIHSLIDSLIDFKKDNFRVYLECAHLAFLTTIVVLVLNFDDPDQNAVKVFKVGIINAGDD